MDAFNYFLWKIKQAPDGFLDFRMLALDALVFFLLVFFMMIIISVVNDTDLLNVGKRGGV